MTCQLFNLPPLLVVIVVTALLLSCTISLDNGVAQAFSPSSTIHGLYNIHSINRRKESNKIRCNTQLLEAPVAASSIGPRQVDMNQYNIDVEDITGTVLLLTLLDVEHIEYERYCLMVNREVNNFPLK